MKKKFLLLVLVAAAAGGVTAYTVARTAAAPRVIEVADKAALSFASFSEDGDRYPDLTYAAEKAVPAVVNIEKKEVVEVEENPFFGGGDPFFEFFGIPQQGHQFRNLPQEKRSGGSGVIISEDGYIISNNHVVENASQLKVTLSDGRSYTAKVIGTDPTTDVALVKIDEKGLPTVPFGNSGDLRLGEWVLAVGSPFGLSSTVTAGIVSAKGRNLDVIPSQFRIESFIQTDAAVNPGNSGGALVNTRGELIGINTVIKSPTGSYAGYSFAIPSAIAKKVVVDLMKYGIVQRAMLGIGFNEINDEFLERFGKETGVKEKNGIYVGSVDPNGAAHAAGIQEGDVITEIDGVKTTGTAALQEIIAQHNPNDRVKVTVKRKGEVKHFEVTLRNKAGETKLMDRNTNGVAAQLGGEFNEVGERLKRELKIGYGVQVVSVGEGLLKRANVRKGYIITHINTAPVRSVSELNRMTEPVRSIDGIYPDGRAVSYVISQ